MFTLLYSLSNKGGSTHVPSSASSFGHLGRGKEAREIIDGMEEYKDTKISDIVLTPWWQLYKEPGPNEHLFDGLRKAGLPE